MRHQVMGFGNYVAAWACRCPHEGFWLKLRHHELRAPGFEAFRLVLAGRRLPTNPNCKATILIVQ